MAFKRTENPDGSWVEEYTGPELADLLDEQPVAECSCCHRKTWEPGMVGRICYMAQPKGGTCPGAFVSMTHGDKQR